MITREDLIVLKEEILKTKKPKETYVQIDYGDRIEKVPVCIIINPKAKQRFITSGIIPITVKEIWKIIKGKNSFREQQESIGRYILEAVKFYQTAENTRKLFDGDYIDIS